MIWTSLPEASKVAFTPWPEARGSLHAILLDDIIREALAPYAGRVGRTQVKGPAIEVGARGGSVAAHGFP